MKTAQHIIDQDIFPPNDSDVEMELQDHSERIMKQYEEWIKKAVPRIPDGDGVAACDKKGNRIDVPPIF